MAFFRFNRDKRGYEHFYLVQPTTNRRGKVRSRVLYWFRTPPGVRVGREPFDEGVRRALEAQNPDVTFDWPTILDAPIPSADEDKWRERRRAERIARHSTAPSADAEPEEEPIEPADADAPARQQPPRQSDEEVVAAPATIAAAPNPSAPAAPDATRKRRRRRRGRRVGAPAQLGQPSLPDEAPEPHERDEPGDPTGD
jgi:hypothetical protein